MTGKERINTRTLKDSNLIVQGNKLINARYKLGLQESRLMYAAMSLIKPEDEDFKKYKINISDLANYLGLVGGNIYTSIKKLTHNLISKSIVIEDEEGWKEFPLLTFAEYEKSDNSITLQFHPEMKPFLIQQKQNFTQAKLQNLIKYGSSYSSRIYLFLREYLAFKRRDILVEDLKNKLELDNYEYNDLKRRVLLPAQSEMEYYSDIRFELIEHKQNKKIYKITFLIYPNNPTSVNEEIGQISAEVINQDEEIEKSFAKMLFKKYDVSKGVGTDLAKEHSKNAPTIFKYIDQQIAKNNNIKNVGGYAVNAIRSREYEVLIDSCEDYEEFVQFKKIIYFESLSSERQRELLFKNGNNLKAVLDNMNIPECKHDFLLSVLEIKDADIERRAKAKKKKIEDDLLAKRDDENSKILESLKDLFVIEYGQKYFDSFLADLKIHEMNDKELVFLASSKFNRDWIIKEMLESPKNKASLKLVVQKVCSSIETVAVIAKT